MKHLPIKDVEKPVTSLIMGSDFFKPSRQEHVANILEEYIEIGGNTVDTAHIYAGGESETAIGQWLEEGNRGRLNILTKGGHPNQNGPTITEHEIHEQLKVSLDRLKSDSVELYALHRDDTDVPVEKIVDWLNEHVEMKRIQAFGASNWTTKRLAEANAYAERNGLKGFQFSSPNLSLAKAQEPYWPGCISADEATLQWHEQAQLPLFSWSSQARGFFTGRYTPENRENEDLVRVFYNDDNWERYRRAETLAKEKDVSIIQIALAYVLNQDFPTSAIVGPQNREEMQSCGVGANLALTKQEVAWLDLATK